MTKEHSQRARLDLDRPLLLAADLHLGPRAATEARLARLLDRLPDEVALIFLGDVVDFWAEGPRYDVGAEYPVLERLRGFDSYFLRGNRDFLIGPRWELMTGGRVLGDELELAAWGRRFLCLHGDTLLKRDKRYQRWRLIARSRPFRAAAALAGPGLAQKWAQRLRKGSEQEVARKSEYELSVSLDFAAELSTGFNALVSGHTHRPGTWPLAGAELVTLGAWDEGAEVLYIDGHGRQFAPVEEIRFTGA